MLEFWIELHAKVLPYSTIKTMNNVHMFMVIPSLRNHLVPVYSESQQWRKASEWSRSWEAYHD